MSVVNYLLAMKLEYVGLMDSAKAGTFLASSELTTSIH
jgi:hypothetical protein